MDFGDGQFYFDFHNQGPVLYPTAFVDKLSEWSKAGYSPERILRGINNLALDKESRGEFPGYREAWLQSGLSGVFASIGIFCSAADRQRAIVADANRYELAAQKGRFISVPASYDALRRSLSEGRKGVFFQVENLDFVKSLSDLDPVCEVGVKIMGLSYNHGNSLASGSSSAVDNGLSALGRAFLAWANERRVAVDLSHASHRASVQAIEALDFPVCTHSFWDQIHPHPRGKSADVLRNLAAKGGLIGVPLHPGLISSGPKELFWDAFREHIVSLCELVGSDFVCIGTDWAGNLPQVLVRLFTAMEKGAKDRIDWNRSVPGYEGIGNWKVILDKLSGMGLAECEVNRIGGGNVLSWLSKVFG